MYMKTLLLPSCKLLIFCVLQQLCRCAIILAVLIVLERFDDSVYLPPLFLLFVPFPCCEVREECGAHAGQSYKDTSLNISASPPTGPAVHLRLERITADCVAPMEAEPSIEGRPPGEQERQPRGQVARPKRARGSGRPETG